jgi:putative restriction endonuclease
MNELDVDTRMRMAAVDRLTGIATAGVVSADDLRAGFTVDQQRIPFINPQRGIFKPAAMRHLLSVRTVFPVSGRKVWYDDQRRVHEQVARGDELIDYAFMGTDPQAADNRWLREAMEAQIPIIYFLGIAPQRYSVIWPTYVADWSAAELKARLAFAPPIGQLASPRLPSRARTTLWLASRQTKTSPGDVPGSGSHRL